MEMQSNLTNSYGEPVICKTLYQMKYDPFPSSTKYGARDGCRYINNSVKIQTESCNNIDIIKETRGMK